MRKVTRSKIPESLSKNASKWTRELLDEIKKVGKYSKVSDKYKTRYNQEDVKKELMKMYSNHCCYCEGKIGTQTFGRIEHLRPKALPQFYNLTFSWNNLHWCCEVCNTRKLNKWDENNPILDPVEDEISAYLSLNIDSGEYEAVDGNLRGENTILHTDMNRESLITARQKIAIKMKRLYFQLNNDNKKIFLDEMESEAEENAYPSVVYQVCHMLRDFEKDG